MNTVMAMKKTFNIEIRIALLQKLFIDNWELAYGKFNFYWPQANKTTIRDVISMRKNLLDKIVIEYRTNLVNCSYFVFLDIWDLD